MNLEELKVAAEIMSNLGDMGVTGLIWFLSMGILKVLIVAIVVLFVAWGAYKLILRFITDDENTHLLRALRRQLGEHFFSDCPSAIKKVQEERSEYKGKYEECNKHTKDYMARLDSLTKEYETLFADHGRQAIEIRRLDPRINDAFDSKEEQKDGSDHTECK